MTGTAGADDLRMVDRRPTQCCCGSLHRRCWSGCASDLYRPP
jgi:hypothetical protein